MLNAQQSLNISEYTNIYDIVVPKDNILRKIKELIDFSFIYKELKDKYSMVNGRTAIDPIQMFKYLLLKVIHSLSDIDVVERSRYDMSFKYFLDIAPEADVINASSLTKFRKLRLKDLELLDLLIGKTVQLAIEKEIIKSKSIIVDSTHTYSRYNRKSAREILVEASKNLRKSVYAIDELIKTKFPNKPKSGMLEDEIKYCEEVIKVVQTENGVSDIPAVKTRLNLLKELVTDDIEQIKISKDEDAKTGHKTADTSFFGYKTHIAMTEERIITGTTVTTGEKHDGKQLQELVCKSKNAGMTIDTIIGDGAYSEIDNIEYAKENNIQLVSKVSKAIMHGKKRKNEFEYNKDAEMYTCKHGEMSIHKSRTTSIDKRTNKQFTKESYFFDISRCKQCPFKEGCYKEGSKTKVYTVTIRTPEHNEHIDFQETEYFKDKSKERYKIETKNGELKTRHGYDIASSSGLVGMEMQGALTIFAVNMKRIIKLMI
ncbi:MAG TPA: IS1182 family transposase [Clostridiales bacterium]|nr:IS1182 family transposase [Clostridiales bacterium]